jgi:hypothetical protein
MRGGTDWSERGADYQAHVALRNDVRAPTAVVAVEGARLANLPTGRFDPLLGRFDPLPSQASILAVGV